MIDNHSSTAKRICTIAYLGFCLIIASTALIDIWTYYMMLAHGAPSPVIFHQVCGSLLKYIELGSFALFLRTIKGAPPIFNRRQPMYLFILGASLLLETLYCLWSPANGAHDELTLAGNVSLVIEGPKLDITLLLFAIFFFCLAAVFKYGAELQKDSDSIL